MITILSRLIYSFVANLCRDSRTKGGSGRSDAPTRVEPPYQRRSLIAERSVEPCKGLVTARRRLSGHTRRRRYVCPLWAEDGCTSVYTPSTRSMRTVGSHRVHGARRDPIIGTARISTEDQTHSGYPTGGFDPCRRVKRRDPGTRRYE